MINYNGTDWKDFKTHLDKPTNKVKDKDYYKIKLPYTRDDDIFDMYLIKWNPSAVTDIHSHTDYGCIFRILEGEMFECIYKKSYTNRNIIKGPYRYKENQVSYIDNDIGQHKISNPSTIETAYSLHVYGLPAILRYYKIFK